MGRTIITGDDLEARKVQEEERERQRREQEQLTGTPLSGYYMSTLRQTADGYTDRLLKYIPAESVALYLTLQGIVLSSVEAPALNAWL